MVHYKAFLFDTLQHKTKFIQISMIQTLTAKPQRKKMQLKAEIKLYKKASTLQADFVSVNRT